MGYVDDELRASAGERLEYRAQLSVWSLVPQLVLGAVLLAVALAVFTFLPTGAGGPLGPLVATFALATAALVPIGSALVRFYCTEIGVTDRRVLFKTGLVRRRTFEMIVEKVESLSIDQSLAGRLLDFGGIRVAAAGEHDIVIGSVEAPLELKRRIDEAKGARLISDVTPHRAAPVPVDVLPSRGPLA